MNSEWDYEQRLFRVYLIANAINGKGYVGITLKPLAVRFAEHIQDAMLDVRRSANGKRYPLHAAILKYGAENFSISELDVGLGLTEAQEKETQYITDLDTYASGQGGRRGYNLSYGGESPDPPYHS